MFPAIDFVRLFQAVDVPVALVQDTLRRYDTGGRSDQGVFNGQGGCDIVYAWGDTSLEYYRRVGVNPGRIVAAGSPRMDRYVRTAAELPSSQEIRRAKNLPLDGWVVLIATNTVYRKTLERPMFIADYFYCIGQAIEWCREIGAFVILKPHGNLLKDYLRWEVPQWIESLPHARVLDGRLVGGSSKGLRCCSRVQFHRGSGASASWKAGGHAGCRSLQSWCGVSRTRPLQAGRQRRRPRSACNVKIRGEQGQWSC